MEPKAKRTWLIVGLGAGLGVALTSLCCCGGIGIWYWVGDRSGVSAGEKREIMRSMDANREAGFQNEWEYSLWEGMELPDNGGKKVKLVRVKFYQRKTPNRVADRIVLLTDGQLHATGVSMIPNTFGDDWRTKGAAIDWDQVRRGLYKPPQ
jgi:hypothetical protein